MKIAIINNFDSFVFNLVRYVREEGCEVVVQRNDEVDFEAIEQCDGILLSPGPGVPEKAGLMPDVIRHFIRKKPILGVCLGHQALAEHFGGSLSLAEVPIHGKSSEISRVSSPLFKALPEKLIVGRYHSWVVATPLPDELLETARFGDQIMAFEHRELPVYGVQFHPESILTPQGRKIIRNFIQITRKQKMKQL